MGPGKSEDKQGRPFVGRAGQLLNELLGVVGLEREEIFITNVVKCFLPDNKPTKEQVEVCTSLYLDKQLEILNPQIIITLGDIATSYIFRKFNLRLEPISKIHGRVFRVNTLKGRKFVISMYHPAVALYNPRMKETLKKDWKNLKVILEK